MKTTNNAAFNAYLYEMLSLIVAPHYDESLKYQRAYATLQDSYYPFSIWRYHDLILYDHEAYGEALSIA